MIRIVGVQRSDSPPQEFVLLQNQGNMRLPLRGHLILCQRALDSSDLNLGSYVFADEAVIPAGMYVLLVTGIGESRWSKTKDGAMIYYAFMNQERSVWNEVPGPMHLLSTQHTYSERTTIAYR